MKTDVAKKYAEESLERIRNHPFVLDASNGRLRKEQALRWIMCAGRESRSFPEILENMISWTENEKIRSILAENLDDEYGNGNPEEAHFMHYLQLIRAIGMTEEDFMAYDENVGIKLAVSLAYNISLLKRPAPVLGYMVVNESMTPVTYLAVKTAIMPYYPDLKTDFFDVHVGVDEEHVRQLYEAIEELEDDLLDELIFGINIGERGMAVLLDEAYGIFDNCEQIPSFNTNLPTAS